MPLLAPALKDLQRQLRFDITHADFLAGAAPQSTAWIKAGPPLAREARVEIYSDAWFLRLYGAIEEDFGAVKRLLGETEFSRVVRHYFTRHPSRTHTLGHVGAEFAEFLEGGAAGGLSAASISVRPLIVRWPSGQDPKQFHHPLSPADARHRQRMTRPRLGP